MAKSLVHLNGNLMCVVDTETTGLDPMIEVTPDIIKDVLALNTKPSIAFLKLSEGKAITFNTVMHRKPNSSDMRHIYASAFAEIFCSRVE